MFNRLLNRIQATKERLQASLERNPVAWLALALFLFAEYNLYQRGHQLTVVCEYVASLGMLAVDPVKSERALRICSDRLAD